MKNINVFKEFAKYASLNVMGMIGMSCYILADTFFVSRGLGTNGLAALNLAIPVFNFINGVGLMLGMGGATKYSISKGRSSASVTNEIFTNTFCLGILFAAVFAAAGIFFSGALTKLMGADETVFEMTNTYLKVMLLFAPAFIINNIIICFVRNDGNPNLSMLGMITGSLANIVLDYIFIFPMNMGIFGAILATGMSPVISLIILCVHFIKKRNGFRFSRCRLDPRMAGGTMSLGLSSLVSELSSGVVIIVFNMIILGLAGNIGVAAYGVIANISLIVTAVYTGLSQGIQPLVSNAYGRGELVTAKLIFKYALLAMAVISLIVYLTVFIFAAQITSIFNSEGNAVLSTLACTGLRIYFTAVVFAGFNIITCVFFTSTERAVPAQIVSMLRGLFLIVPAAFLLSHFFGINGTWLSYPITELLTALTAAVLLKRFSPEKHPLH